jgi:type II secretion system protein H
LRPAGRRSSAGFTLLELMVVIAIAALAIQIVVVNLGSMIPRTILDGECNQFLSKLDFLRSEARLQGQRYRMELDLNRHLWRYVLPAEERLTTEQTLEETMPEALSWNTMEEGVQFMGIVQSGIIQTGANLEQHHGVQSNGIAAIEFDENGFTADWNVFFTLAHDQELVWTVQLFGLTGRSRLLTSFDGQPQPARSAEEFGF